ncbi:hypothetical protein [Gordonia sp. (in: high G+C Gram-positive bacteria)]|uniref:hypothetical protein n=1 Tax=Gordonia sp. (in: high G+C Gram-positive bacteria) TaxID=84139 RepID=UPI0033417E7E
MTTTFENTLADTLFALLVLVVILAAISWIKDTMTARRVRRAEAQRRHPASTGRHYIVHDGELIR